VDDLRAALSWALLDGNDLELGGRLAAASMYFIFVAPDEGRAYVLLALRAVDQHPSRHFRAKLHHALSRHANHALHYAEAYEASQHAIALARELGEDDLLCAFTLNAVMAAVGTQRLDEAESFATECIRIARARGHRLFERQAREFLPAVVSSRGDFDRARSLFVELLESDNLMLEDGVAFHNYVVSHHSNFAENEFLAGRLGEAVRLSERAVALAAEYGDLPGLRYVRSILSAFLCAASRFDEARALALVAMEDARHAGLAALVTFALGTLAQVTEARGRIIESAAIAAYVSRRPSDPRVQVDSAKRNRALRRSHVCAGRQRFG